MAESSKRVAWIISFMYFKDAELVVNVSDLTCYLFFDGRPQNLVVYSEEVDCLLYHHLIEFDSGCGEPGHQTMVYILTDFAKQKIKEVIQAKTPPAAAGE